MGLPSEAETGQYRSGTVYGRSFLNWVSVCVLLAVPERKKTVPEQTNSVPERKCFVLIRTKSVPQRAQFCRGVYVHFLNGFFTVPERFFTVKKILDCKKKLFRKR